MAQGTTRSAPRQIGFFGCNDDVGVLSADEATTGEPVLLEKCPCCGHGHTVRPYWRRRMRALDAGRPTLHIGRSRGVYPPRRSSARG